MALSSMTGFARSHGASGPYTFEWELKSVNAKGFDLRVRLPQGFDELEAYAKKRAGELLSRGTVYANLTVKRANAAASVRVNEDVLNAVLKAAAVIAGKVDAVAPSVDGLLSIKGVIEVAEPEGDEEEDKAARAAAAEAFDKALAELVEMRKREGTSLGQILIQRVDEVEQFATELFNDRVEKRPWRGRRPKPMVWRGDSRLEAFGLSDQYGRPTAS